MLLVLIEVINTVAGGAQQLDLSYILSMTFNGKCQAESEWYLHFSGAFL